MQTESEALTGARHGDPQSFEKLVAPYRRQLRAHCYRLSGSIQDADDLLQESLLRIWKGLPTFEGRSSLRTWLYRVTTSACLDALEHKSARVLPQGLGAALGHGQTLRAPRFEPIWLEPCPDEIIADAESSPDARYTARESITLAFLAALQLLPPRQRAVLLLRDVLGWPASEAAELLEMSVAAANSALQRARETLTEHSPTSELVPDDAETSQLLAEYVRAWERADVPALVAILHRDAMLAMPPLPDWIAGAEAIGAALSAMVLTPEAAGRAQLISIRANGGPAFAGYERDSAGVFRAKALHLLELEGGRIRQVTSFFDPSLFARLGLPDSR